MNLSQPWQGATFVAFDIETSGQYPVQSEICELGAVKWAYRDGQAVVLDTFESLIATSCPMPQEVIDIHHISNEMLADAPGVKEVLQKFLAFSEGCVFVAHHAPFDMGFLAYALEENALPLPTAPAFCTSLLARQLIPESPRHKLGVLAQHLNIPVQNLHRALDDAQVCRQIMHSCCLRAAQKSSTQPAATPEQAKSPKQTTGSQAAAVQTSHPQAAAVQATNAQTSGSQASAVQTADTQTAAPQASAVQTADTQTAAPQASDPNAATLSLQNLLAYQKDKYHSGPFRWTDFSIHQLLKDKPYFEHIVQAIRQQSTVQMLYKKGLPPYEARCVWPLGLALRPHGAFMAAWPAKITTQTATEQQADKQGEQQDQPQGKPQGQPQSEQQGQPQGEQQDKKAADQTKDKPAQPQANQYPKRYYLEKIIGATLVFFFVLIVGVLSGSPARAESFFFNPNWQSGLSMGAFYDDSLLFTETGLASHLQWLPSDSFRYRLSSLMRLKLYNRSRKSLEVINLNRHIYSQNKKHHFADPSDAYISVLYKIKPSSRSLLKMEPYFYLFLQDNNFDAQREVVAKRAGLHLHALILHTHFTQRYYVNSFYDFFLQPSKKVGHLQAPMVAGGAEYSLLSSSNQEARLRLEFSWYHAGHKDLNYKQGLVAASYLQPFKLASTQVLWLNDVQAAAMYFEKLKWRFQARSQLAHNISKNIRYGVMAYATQLYVPINSPASQKPQPSKSPRMDSKTGKTPGAGQRPNGVQKPAGVRRHGFRPAQATEGDDTRASASASKPSPWHARQLGVGLFLSAGF